MPQPLPLRARLLVVRPLGARGRRERPQHAPRLHAARRPRRQLEGRSGRNPARRWRDGQGRARRRCRAQANRRTWRERDHDGGGGIGGRGERIGAHAQRDGLAAHRVATKSLVSPQRDEHLAHRVRITCIEHARASLVPSSNGCTRCSAQRRVRADEAADGTGDQRVSCARTAFAAGASHRPRSAIDAAPDRVHDIVDRISVARCGDGIGPRRGSREPARRQHEQRGRARALERR